MRQVAIVVATKGGPAARAGIHEGDVITEVNGEPATSIRVCELRRALRDDVPGTLVHFTIRRGGQMHEVDVKLRDQI